MHTIAMKLFMVALLLLIFLVPAGLVVLTVNEELFVFLSFVIFVDLFGNLLMNALALIADNKISVTIDRYTVLLIQRVLLLVELQFSLNSIYRMVGVRKSLINQFWCSLRNIVRSRWFDRLYLHVQLFLNSYKVVLYYYFVTLKFVSLITVNIINPVLRDQLLLSPRIGGEPKQFRGVVTDKVQSCVKYDVRTTLFNNLNNSLVAIRRIINDNTITKFSS